MADFEVSRESSDQINVDYSSHSRNMEIWRQSMDLRNSYDVNENNVRDTRGSMSSLLQSRREPKDMLLFVSKPAEYERQGTYKGRIRTWPGLFLLLLLVGGAVVGIVVGSKSYRDASNLRQANYLEAQRAKRAIDSGLDTGTNSSTLPIDVDTDGQVGNPKVYVTKQCSSLSYLSKGGRIVAVLPNKTEVKVDVKGINWFGMETGNAIPFGLWTNDRNGTTAYEIATFLAKNKFNAVRLPVCIKHILDNTAPRKNLVNLAENRALDLTSYMSALQSIIKALAYRKIGVLISLHTLTPASSGGTWFDDSLGITKEKFLTAVDTLAKNLCTQDYWNVIGLDLKNEPHTSSWADFADGAGTIGTRMLKGCSNWLAFVEGTNLETHKASINGVVQSYFDWWGGGLQGVKTKRVELPVDDKVVYAPHYYNSGVYPQPYFYGAGKAELSDADLLQAVSDSATDMFGYIAKDKKEALVLGEFAGLYATDLHPMKTTKRTTDFLIQVMLRDGYAGGFMWSLNPESEYQYNPTGPSSFTEGLLKSDWLTSNTEFVKGMAAMDALPNLQFFPCVLTDPK
ncbi:unnamed protein product [Aphanomyces euteiches]|uniref:Glycoside hydrolase family 5 domain-containing protein n=1 Tax=Aphanomyces euteiches TaxID=100861 RepID=A0A6G0WS76_9STRA|nr:hypothetical protein Ae201684_012329 [Aphanomyces euteiches]KAH9096680.1 hypothetical protein Ae201684P_013346 [Aphanomyces euteiches]KAH9157228.1 hypothetical protein AeRB84_000903 [Aphanomyces euteiches]